MRMAYYNHTNAVENRTDKKQNVSQRKVLGSYCNEGSKTIVIVSGPDLPYGTLVQCQGPRAAPET